MEPVEQLQRLGVALAIGLLIGIERGWQSREEREGERAAGLRTHALAALLGGLWAIIAQELGQSGALALAGAFLALSSAIILFRYRETGHDGSFGATTVVAAMLAFTLGATAVLGDMAIAAAGGVAVAALLALKGVLHSWVERISWLELRSALLLLAMTFICLPILPNRTIDPWQAVNPFEIWLLTIMIAGISFAGYIAIKLAGDHLGTVMSGIAGGLVSSTAVTLTMSRLAREHPDHTPVLLAGVLMAGATMMVRVLFVAGLVNASLLAHIAPPIGMAGLMLAAVGFYALTRGGRAGGDTQGLALRSPFELATVLKFGALLTVITVLTKIVTGGGGSWGAYALAAISGVADVDAIVLSMARLSSGPLDNSVAVRAILIVVAVNTAMKAVLAWITGGTRIGRPMVLAAVAAIGMGLIAHLF